MLRLHRTEKHAWIITKAVSEHNHPLSESYGEKKNWGSHGEIDPMTKDFIKKLRTNNVTLGRVCSIIGVSSSNNVSTLRKQSIKNLCAKLAQEEIKDDIKKTLDMLHKMKTSDSNMEVKILKNKQGQIESMLWCIGKNKQDY